MLMAIPSTPALSMSSRDHTFRSSTITSVTRLTRLDGSALRVVILTHSPKLEPTLTRAPMELPTTSTSCWKFQVNLLLMILSLLPSKPMLPTTPSRLPMQRLSMLWRIQWPLIRLSSTMTAWVMSMVILCIRWWTLSSNRCMRLWAPGLPSPSVSAMSGMQRSTTTWSTSRPTPSSSSALSVCSATSLDWPVVPCSGTICRSNGRPCLWLCRPPSTPTHHSWTGEEP